MTLQVTNMARSPIPAATIAHEGSVFPMRKSDTFLVDLTLYARTGLRGKMASQVVEKAGYKVPSTPNQAIDTNRGTVLRLSAKEFWLLSNSDNKALPEFTMGSDCYNVFCDQSHAWLAFKSPNKADVMAKVCGVDLREPAFSLGSIAQTIVAGSSAIIVHHQLGTQVVFSILCDRSVAHYVWTVMLDAMDEFNGTVATLDSLSA